MAAGARRRQQGAHPDRQGQQGQHRPGAQEARGLLVDQEGPPQLVCIGGVAIGEEAQPQHGRHRRRQHQQPARPQRLAQARAAIEGRPAWRQQGRRQGQLDRLLPVQPLHQREDRPHQQDRQRRVIGAPPTSPQPRRDQQQDKARHAGRKVGQVDQQRRIEAAERAEPVAEGGRHRRQQHHPAQQEGGDREHLRRQLIGQPRQATRDPPRVVFCARFGQSTSEEQESVVWGE